jgi:hypothetical protein
VDNKRFAQPARATLNHLIQQWQQLLYSSSFFFLLGGDGDTTAVA